MHAGMKFIPLRTPGGELIPGSGLFVKIRKADAVSGCTTDLEADEHGGTTERPRLFPLQLYRQVFDIEIGNSTKATAKEEAENDEAEGESRESKRRIDEGFQHASYRRFTSPATLDC